MRKEINTMQFGKTLAVEQAADLAAASAAGDAACKAHRTCVPAIDKTLMALVAKWSTPEFTHSGFIRRLLDAWSKSFLREVQRKSEAAYLATQTTQSDGESY